LVAAWAEPWEPEFSIWAEEIESFEWFRVAQMAGESFLPDEVDEYDLRESALLTLVNQEKHRVLDCLTRHWKGESYLFLSLWLTNYTLEDGTPLKWKESILEDYADEVLNDMRFDMPEKMQAFEWITDGMP